MNMLFILVVVFSLLLGHTESETPREGLLIIPGLGRQDRLATVVHNIRMMQHKLNGTIEELSWDCIIYIYSEREYKVTPKSFWYDKKSHAYLRENCEVIEHPNKRVTENLFLVQPGLIRRSYSYVFILLDDCRLIGRDPVHSSSINNNYNNGGDLPRFQMDKLLSIMEFNELTLASPYVGGANKGGGQGFRNIMQTDAVPGTEGYVSTFVEMFAMLMTMDAYRAFWELLCPSINPFGWGYDLWYDNYAKKRVAGHRMGIISTVRVLHEQNLTTTVRTDNTKPEDKWKALVFQERFYQSHYGITLHKYRETMDLKNHSWNGAVKGYLYAPASLQEERVYQLNGNSKDEKKFRYKNLRRRRKFLMKSKLRLSDQ